MKILSCDSNDGWFCKHYLWNTFGIWTKNLNLKYYSCRGEYWCGWGSEEIQGKVVLNFSSYMANNGDPSGFQLKHILQHVPTSPNLIWTDLTNLWFWPHPGLVGWIYVSLQDPTTTCDSIRDKQTSSWWWSWSLWSSSAQVLLCPSRKHNSLTTTGTCSRDTDHNNRQE